MTGAGLFDDAGIGEPEKDANAILIDLDKGLRSGLPGEQCEAIVRFPALFEKYPFPILINSAALKLSDVFRNGSNFLRLCILRVCQQSEKHLEKVVNADEFLRRIFSVIHSNDPVARAITLRTLGSLAPIICERKNVHHSIISGLDSHDNVELEAAIVATTKFAAQSRTFSTSICNKLYEIIQGLETPMEIKMKLIPVFEYMYHDAGTATRVREFCTSLLLSYPSCDFILITLHTLTQLSTKSLIDIPKQVDLLLDYAEQDSRRAVKVMCLRDMRILAKKGPHMWTQTSVERLCAFAISTTYSGLRMGALQVLCTLTKTIAITKFKCDADDAPVFQICRKCGCHGNAALAATATELMTDLATGSVRAGAPYRGGLCDRSANALDALIIVTATEKSAQAEKALETCLKSVVKLCSVCPAMSKNFISTITGVLNLASGRHCLLLAESLCAIGSRHQESLESSMADIVGYLKELSEPEDGHTQKLAILLMTCIFQAFSNMELPDEIYELVGNFVADSNHWVAYKVIRQAMRYGHHGIAAQLCHATATKVCTEHYYFWLCGLENFSQGEQDLTDLDPGDCKAGRTINKATVQYYKGLSSIRAAVTPAFPLTFQTEYCRLRAETLQAHNQLINACCSFRTNPPPAIATSMAQTTGHDYHKCGRGASQLNKCGEQYSALVQLYASLYQASFDADAASLLNVQLLQQSCQLVVHAIDTIIHKKNVADFLDSMISDDLLNCLETRPLAEVFKQSLTELRQLCTNGEGKGESDVIITHKHVDYLTKMAVKLAKAPLCVPRYFFQTLQSTSIKLAISPQPRGSDPVTIQADTNLTLKVEGVILHGRRPGLHRTIKEINIDVSSVLQSRLQLAGIEIKLQENPPNQMSRRTEPHNDYFSAQFLLSFPVLGMHLILIEASIVDGDGFVWKTGPRATISVKSYDELLQRQQQQQQRTLQAAQRAQKLL